MAVTGERGSVVRNAIRAARGYPTDKNGAHMPVQGLSNSDLLGAMTCLGWRVVEQWDTPNAKLSQRVKIPDPKGNWYDGSGGRFRYERKRPEGFKPVTFADFLTERGATGPYIVNVTGHYMAVSHGEVCDASSTFLPTDIDRYLTRGKYRYRQAWVWHWWRFEQ